MDIDSLDRALIAALQADPRAGNRMLAQQLGTAEATVATRIRSLFDRRVVRSTVQIDTGRTGDDIFAYVDIHVAGREVAEIVEDLAAIECVSAINLTLGTPEIVLHVHARDRVALTREVLPLLAAVPGVRRIESHVALEVLKYSVEYGSILD